MKITAASTTSCLAFLSQLGGSLKTQTSKKLASTRFELIVAILVAANFFTMAAEFLWPQVASRWFFISHGFSRRLRKGETWTYLDTLNDVTEKVEETHGNLVKKT